MKCDWLYLFHVYVRHTHTHKNTEYVLEATGFFSRVPASNLRWLELWMCRLLVFRPVKPNDVKMTNQSLQALATSQLRKLMMQDWRVVICCDPLFEMTCLIRIRVSSLSFDLRTRSTGLLVTVISCMKGCDTWCGRPNSCHHSQQQESNLFELKNHECGHCFSFRPNQWHTYDVYPRWFTFMTLKNCRLIPSSHNKKHPAFYFNARNLHDLREKITVFSVEGSAAQRDHKGFGSQGASLFGRERAHLGIIHVDLGRRHGGTVPPLVSPPIPWLGSRGQVHYVQHVIEHQTCLFIINKWNMFCDLYSFCIYSYKILYVYLRKVNLPDRLSYISDRPIGPANPSWNHLSASALIVDGGLGFEIVLYTLYLLCLGFLKGRQAVWNSLCFCVLCKGCFAFLLFFFCVCLFWFVLICLFVCLWPCPVIIMIIVIIHMFVFRGQWSCSQLHVNCINVPTRWCSTVHDSRSRLSVVLFFFPHVVLDS